MHVRDHVRLNEMRKQAGLTQAELARRVTGSNGRHPSRSVISLLTSGIRSSIPDRALAYAIAGVLDCKLSDLFTEDRPTSSARSCTP